MRIWIVTESPARTNFKYAHGDALSLMQLHDDVRPSSRRSDRHQALRKGALVLAFAAWESYVEDTVRELAGANVHASSDSGAPTSIGKLFLDVLDEELRRFHSPRSDQVDRLYRRFLGVRVSDGWRWRGMAPARARGKLDALLKLRGQSAHRGSKLHPGSPPVPPIPLKRVREALDFLPRLVASTDASLGVACERQEYSG